MQRNLAPIPELYVSYDSAQKLKTEAGRPDQPRPDPAPDLRPGTADERRLQPAQRVPERRGLQRRRRQHASCRRRALADADHPGCVREIRRDRRSGPGHRAARSGRRDPRHDDGHRQMGAEQGARGREGLWRRRHRAPGRQLPAQHRRQGLSRRPDHRHPAAGALRFPRAPRHAQRIARLFPQARLAPRRGVPDPQPAAPRTSGTDLPRRERGAGQPADPSRRRHDQARRCRSLHPRALLRGGAGQVPARDHDDEPAEPRHAHGRPARGRLARPDPRQPRLHPFHRRSRPRRARARIPRARISTAPTTRRMLFKRVRG